MKRSRARYGVVGFCFAQAMVTSIDRACIGVLAGPIRSDLGLSMTQMGYVFSAFTFAYATVVGGPPQPDQQCPALYHRFQGHVLCGYP